MRMLSLREKARLLEEFKSLRLFILDAVSVYITVNNYDLIISNRVVISRNTGLYGKKYVAYAVGHDDHCLRVCCVCQLLFFFGVFGKQGECLPCSPKSLLGYCKKNVKNL